jgi:thioredoxin-like negative regulator of GroEL
LISATMIVSPFKMLWLVLFIMSMSRKASCLPRNNQHVQVTWMRGGGNVDSSRKRLDWLNMDRDTLQGYMELAKQRHADAVRRAEESYWSASKESSEKMEEDLPSVYSYGIDAPPTWSLPDFDKDFDVSKMIYVTQTPLFTKEECNRLIQLAESHFGNGDWTTLPSGQYDVAGFWIKSVPAVHEQFNEMLRRRLFPLLQQQFPQFCSFQDLVVDSAYVFKYTTETGRRTDVHTDSGCVSFTIAVNGPEDYEGGGTWFQALNHEDPVIEMAQGHVTVRPGGVRHCGQAVTKGTRYIIGGFCMHRKKVEYVRMLIGLGAERYDEGNYKGAQEALEAALCLNPNFDSAYANLANVLQKLGDKEKAQEALEHCHFHVNPQNGEVAYSLGVVYLNNGEYEKCKSCLQACLEVDDGDTDAIMGMAQACSALGDRDDEEQWYQRLVNTPGVPDKLAAAAYCNWGILHEGSDNEIAFYGKGLELAPDHFTLRFSLASAQAGRKNWPDAAENFKLAVDSIGASDPQKQSQALAALYRVAVNMVQSEFQASPTSQAAMLERIQSIMGKENYARLAASRG